MRLQAKDLEKFIARGQLAQNAVNALTTSSSPRRTAGVMNRLETRYSQRLELERLAGLWQWFSFEAITLRLPGGVRYTPDFPLIDAGGHLVFHEVKGFWRDDARIKIRVAAGFFSGFRFVGVSEKRERRGEPKHWDFEEF